MTALGIPPITLLPYAGDRPKPRTLREAAQEFAAIFTQQLLKFAFKAEGFLSGGKEVQGFYDQLSWEYAKLIAKRNDGGITKLILRSLDPKSLYEKTVERQGHGE